MHIAAKAGRPKFDWMETVMTKSKTIAFALATLTLAGTFAATSGSAQAHSHWGVGIGFAAGALIGAAAATNAYAPVYVAPGCRDCRLVERYDRWGNARLVRICNIY